MPELHKKIDVFRLRIYQLAVHLGAEYKRNSKFLSDLNDELLGLMNEIKKSEAKK